ncbi:MAG TPA: sigma-70 family RNA polymerase sigma factor [Gemmatimonadaceae bacterium]|nr:sigma-70 family RNA polymerase sigma factor [Gemmatimonadaceae bacterium]
MSTRVSMPITPTDVAPTPSPARPADAAGSARHSVHGVTELLRAWGAGNAEASDSLVRLVYAELRRQAQLVLRREDEGHTLQPTALVHEAWLRLGDQQDARWESRAQFFAIAAQMMRRVLLDHARARHALKRGAAAAQVSLGDGDFFAATSGARPGQGTPIDPLDVIALDDALARLAVLDPQKARLVELRYFAGLSIPEAADALGVSTATIGREWAIARMWLRRELER